MNRVTLEAELDATKSKKPDTSEADRLRKELQDLKTEHQASLMTAQQTAEQATQEHLATRAALDKIKSQLEKEQAERKSDFDDMHSSLTQVCEEATKRASEAESKLEEVNNKASDTEARLKEAEAVIKVKEAELAEAQVREFPINLQVGGSHANESEKDKAQHSGDFRPTNPFGC